MSIDFILDYDCQPKKLLGLGGVLDGAKIRQQSEQVRQLTEAGEMSADEKITLLRITPSGALDQEELTARQLEQRAAGYDRHAGHCRGCPANVLERVRQGENLFGCHGTINYPLSQELEFLLYVTLRFIGDRQMDAPPSRLLHFILESGITGEAVQNARQAKPEQGSQFAARGNAFSHTFPGPQGEATIDTDQLLEAMFFGNRIEPQVAKFLFVPFFETMEQMINVLLAEKKTGAAARLADRGVLQLREFGAAVAIAAELGCHVVIDL